MNRSRRAGFTLVELLVVMAIIGILVALLLPAVNAAREAARKATCTKNLGELSMALVAYESRKRNFPGYKNRLAVNGNVADDRIVSWVAPILPDLGRNDLYDRIVAGTGNVAAVYSSDLDITRCPNDPPLSGGAAWNSYIVNCGFRGKVDVITGDNTNRHPFNSTYAGVFNNLADYRPGSAPSSGNKNTPLPPHLQEKVSSADIASNDGVSNTILLSEHSVVFKCENWTESPASSPARPVCDAAANNELARLWEPNRNDDCLDYIVGFWIEDLQESNDDRPKSKHPDGTHYAFADGHVVFLSENVDLKTVQKLMTPQGSYMGSNAPLKKPPNDPIPWPQSGFLSGELER
jgi:prepilin-type N-terminal cleavage/methylation domain-containing protein/prepilin-type processing-associated H-X9-DG protein